MAKLTVIIGASVSGLVNNTKKGFNRVVSTAKSAMSKVRSIVSSAAGMFGIGFGTAAAISGIKKLVDEMDYVGKASKRIGVSAEEFQKIAFASRRTGSTNENVERAFKKMQQTIYDASKGLKTYQQYLTDLGLTYQDLAGKSPEKQFSILADKLNQVEDATTRAALAQKIFGRAGTNIMPMIGEYNDLKKEFEDIGGIVSNEAVKAAEDFKDSLENISSSIKAGVINSGLLSWLKEVAAEFDAMNKDLDKIANRKGIKTRQQVEKEVEASIEKDYKNNPEFRKQFDDTVKGYKKGQGFTGIIKRSFKHTVGDFGSVLSFGMAHKEAQKYGKSSDPRQMAFEREKAIRMSKYYNMKGNEALISRPTTQKDINTKKASEEAEFRKEEANMNAMESAYMDEQAAIEEKQTAKVKESIAALDEKLKRQQLILQGKEKEVAVQDAIKKAEKDAGRSLTDAEKIDIGTRAEKLYDMQNPDKDKATKERRALVADSGVTTNAVRSIGGSLGSASTAGASNIQRQTANNVKTINDAVRSINSNIINMLNTDSSVWPQ